jgi:hypothetical protein
VALSVELPLRIVEAALIENLLAALLLAVQDALQDALEDALAAKALAGGATRAVSFVDGTSPDTRVFTLTVGLPAAVALAGGARRRRAQTGAQVDLSAALGGLLESGYMQARFAEAGVPDSDALFTSGALSLTAAAVAPPTAPPLRAAGFSGGAAAGVAISAAIALLVLAAGVYSVIGRGSEATKAALWLRSAAIPVPARRASVSMPAAYADIDLSIYAEEAVG